MIGTKALFALAFMVGGTAGMAHAIELDAATVEAWRDYLTSADGQLRKGVDAEQALLWSDQAPERAARVRRGEIVVAPLAGRGTRDVPGGLIHDWIGAAFIPNATIEALQAVVHDYDRYKQIYKPVVTESKALACDTADQEFVMIWQRRVLFVNVAMRGQYEAHDVSVGPHRGYSVVDASRIQQIEAYGHSSEYLLPPDTGSGFIWRLHSIARYEERDGGVYLEIRAMALTRNIPPSLHWLVAPVVNHLSVNSLTTTLRQTRRAVRDSEDVPEQLAMRKRSK